MSNGTISVGTLFLAPVGVPVGGTKGITLAAVVLFSVGALGACGSTTGERAISGGGIGAGAGALGGFMLGAPLEGALLGGAVGAGTGALTNPSQINLGHPVWK